MLQTPGPHGYPPQASCPKCGHTQDWSDEEAATTARSALRTITDPDVHLPMRDVRLIWPTLKPATLRKWVERGHVTRTEAGYNIAQINACILWPNMVVLRA